ncbi:glycogen debranching N-terminal domain-containing protein, partial [Plantactinospora sp. GCM10030261]|uniref:amylo-alpha-1,6-glucosidase n=1 Tax=Plantactinospora sp. GCM10030261 TaxID=3273420 RepID=UPI00361CA4A4
MPQRLLQPLLHDLVSVVLAPTSSLSDPAGQIRSGAGVQGVFHADARVLSRAELLVDDRETETIGHAATGPHEVRFVGLARWLGDDMPDPTVRIDRIRTLVPGGLTEEIQVVSTASVPVRARITLDLATDLAPIELVKSGGRTDPLPAKVHAGELTWSADDVTVTVTGDGGSDGATAEADPDRLTWAVDLSPGGRTTLRWSLRADDSAAVVVHVPGEPAWARPAVTAGDHRLVRLLDRSLADLRGLRLAEAARPDEVFLGAGVPWFLTLFGRDSMWAARMMLPLGTELAASTLRVLARRQGERVDPQSGEAPGKILHELRRHESTHVDGGLHLPAAYYGSVDGTLLWVTLLHDAWRWGMPTEEVAELLPHLESALRWLGEHADPDGDGFVEYVDTSGRGLANQGWKDSGDAVRFRDGSQGRSPIALVEVQGYAHQAALAGAALLDAFGRPGAQRWRDYAGDLAVRFRDRFWVDGPQGPHPALALDGDKRAVDSLTSNIGHLLGTGLLSDAEEARVAAVLATPEMTGGFGIRTMSGSDTGFSPLSYHCGSIWSHDTAIVLAGLAAAGFDEAAAELADGLLTAAESLNWRLPELYSGDDRTLLGRPVPYPAACVPQAWSAAAAVTVLHQAIGLRPDVPAGRVHLRPMAGTPFGPITARGLRIAGAQVDVTVDATGRAELTGLPHGLELVTGPAIPAQRPPSPHTPSPATP